MTLKERFEAAKTALAEVKSAVEAGEKSAEDLQNAITELETVQEQIKAADEAEALMKGLETPTAEKADKENIEMSIMEELAKKAAEMEDRKSGVSVHVKAATDVVSAPQIADIDRAIAPQPKRVAAADFFSNATISGNAITYFRQGAYEGTPAVTAQGAKKPQNSTSFTPTTLALSKIAAYIKETDEIIWDASFLASEVQNSLVHHLGVVEDATIVTTVAGTSGILTVTLGTGESLADGIIGAIMKIKDASAYDASVVIMNPADFLAALKAKDGNDQYYGGGYFTGAYGTGAYGVPTSIWGVPVFTNSNITAGTALVAAREAVKVWRKGGLDVKLYEQNEDDALYNRVTLLAEERLACAVVDLNGVCKIS